MSEPRPRRRATRRPSGDDRRLRPPDDGVVVRMYRIGHGDCFLLAMPRDGGGEPVYVLIDCGYKPGSPGFIPDGDRSIEEIVNHLGASTGFHLDLVVLTHEHQDHLNGIWKKDEPYFKDFTIDEAWLSWTEDGEDALANELRRRHRDQLLGLLEARRKLALAVGESHASIGQVDALLSLEVGGGSGDAETVAAMGLALDDPAKSANKQGLKLVKDKARANRGVAYLSPGGKPLGVPGTAGVRAFVLGPPRDADLLEDEDPVGGEGFPGEGSRGFTFRAAATAAQCSGTTPFSPRYCVPMDEALSDGFKDRFFRDRYGRGEEGTLDEDQAEVHDGAPWRRIDAEWLFSAEELALKLNTGINNTSLVLAFELPRSRKVLLFVGDAQRGNWISWSGVEWDSGDEEVSARDLLARTVLYKVGHHASHNATLNGKVEDEHANLSWMATEPSAASEFTAMITAVNEWALTKNTPPCRHPLPSIKRALLRKASGRVFQTDEPTPGKPDDVSDSSWESFLARARCEKLYFDYTIRDKAR